MECGAWLCQRQFVRDISLHPWLAWVRGVQICANNYFLKKSCCFSLTKLNNKYKKTYCFTHGCKDCRNIMDMQQLARKEQINFNSFSIFCACFLVRSSYVQKKAKIINLRLRLPLPAFNRWNTIIRLVIFCLYIEFILEFILLYKVWSVVYSHSTTKGTS